MNINATAIAEAIYRALSALNEERNADEQIIINDETCLFGEGSVLDSLSLVSVIVDLETIVSDEFGKPISLTDDRAMSRNPVPFVNVKALKSYLLELLME
jgi:acyl carrier protein